MQYALQNPSPHQHNKNLNTSIELTPHRSDSRPSTQGETCSPSLTFALLSSAAGESPFSLRERAEIVGLDVGSLVPKLAKFVVFSGTFRVESVREVGVSVSSGDPR